MILILSRLGINCMNNKVYVLMPDQTSGVAFDQVLREHGVDTHAVLVNIAPRVTPEGTLSDDPQVAMDLAREIQKAHDLGYQKMVIACNTLQFFLPEALSQIADKVKKEMEILTTFDSVRRICPDPAECPLWIGTKPTAHHVKKHGFKSLYDMGRPDLQELVQEIIWRVKGVNGDDVSAVPAEVKSSVSDKKILEEKVHELLVELNSLGEARYVMGCTELPVALVGKVGPEAIDPAVEVARMLTRGV